MSNSTIRRSVATLGVVAGLLAAAVPASAATPASGWTDGNNQPRGDYDRQGTQVSLGRENSIECLVRAGVSGER